MRPCVIAGNWKMNGSVILTKELLSAFVESESIPTMIVFPPYVYLSETQKLLQGVSSVQWGGQSISARDQGAFTGEISGGMLKEFGCCYVLVGHSERRHGLGESNAIVAEKYAAAKRHGLTPILCVGETEAERATGKMETVIQAQLDAVLTRMGNFEQAIIAYEPVWAIGTGLVATPEQAQATHHWIRTYISDQVNEHTAQTLPILYGGSVDPNNAASRLAMPDIDGALVGGASLKAESFLSIVRSAEAVYAGCA